MDKLAYVSGETFLYWNSIVLTLAAATAICFFLAFYLYKSGNALAGFTAVPACLGLSLVLARFFHWYCRADSYPDFLSAMTDYTSGGYALMGVFLGCFLVAVVLRLLQVSLDLGEMLDCMSIAACAGIAVGRLNSLFNATDRGNILAHLTQLPFAYPVTNAVSGAQEYRLATFMIQAMVAFALLILLSLTYIRGNKKGNLPSGDTCYIFLLLYGASQVVLDSTRYDSMFFRSNGFVSVVQVLGALALALNVVVFSHRMVKRGGFHLWQIPIWLGIAASMGGAGFMEYYVQRRGNEAAFAYSIMMLCLLVIIALTLLIRAVANKGRQ